MADGQRGHRVTVLDDSPELLELFGDILRFDGVEASLFSASATLSEIEASAPDVLVMDLRLAPDRLSGMEMIRLIRAHRALSGVPIIVCSAVIEDMRQHEDALSRIPRCFVLGKPFSLDELESCLSEALGTPVGARD